MATLPWLHQCSSITKSGLQELFHWVLFFQDRLGYSQSFAFLLSISTPKHCFDFWLGLNYRHLNNLNTCTSHIAPFIYVFFLSAVFHIEGLNIFWELFQGIDYFDVIINDILQFSFPDIMLLVYKNRFLYIVFVANNLAKSTCIHSNGLSILLNFLHTIVTCK